MKKWVVAILAFVLFVAWCEFRPKRLVINQRVNDKFPTTGSAWIAEAIEARTFHAVVQLRAQRPSLTSVMADAFSDSRTSDVKRL